MNSDRLSLIKADKIRVGQIVKLRNHFVRVEHRELAGQRVFIVYSYVGSGVRYNSDITVDRDFQVIKRNPLKRKKRKRIPKEPAWVSVIEQRSEARVQERKSKVQEGKPPDE